MQYTNENPSENLEIRIYTGDNGKFELYEDEGTNYNYEKGAFSIPFEWNEQKQALTIGKRKGEVFNGLIENRAFNIVWVNESNGVGIENGRTNISVKYNGNTISIRKKIETNNQEIKFFMKNLIDINPLFKKRNLWLKKKYVTPAI